MKRFIQIMLAMLLVFTIGAYAQTAEPVQGTDYASVFSTFAALVAVIPFVVEFVKKIVPAVTKSSRVTQIVSWIIGIAVTFAGWFMHLGFLDGVAWQTALLYGIGASLCANGVADVGLVQWIVAMIAPKKKL